MNVEDKIAKHIFDAIQKWNPSEELINIVRDAVLAERESCAKIAEDMAWTNKNTQFLGPEMNCMKIASLIRAREK